MRFMIYILAIFSVVVARGDNFSNLELTNRGVETPRSEVVSYDLDGFFEDGGKMETLYVKPIEAWTQQGETFTTHFTPPFKWLGRQQYLRLHGVAAAYSVAVNGVEIAKVMDGSALTEVDITKALHRDQSNTISMTLDRNAPTKVVEAWSVGANVNSPIGESYIFSQPTQMVRDIAIECEKVGGVINTQIKITVKSHALNTRTSTIFCELTRESGEILASVHNTITQSMRGEESFLLNAKIPVEEAWNIESTNFLLLQIKVQHEGRNTEFQTYSIGVRDARISESGDLMINGQEVKAVAKHIPHNFDPEQIYDLKDEGVNTVVIGAGGYNRALYDACDREGMYVITTAPINSSGSPQSLVKGGNPSNDPQWRAAYEQRVERHILTTKIHPSVVAYAIGESSFNGYNLYESYLKAKELAGSRAVVYLNNEGEWNSDKLNLNIKK